MPTALAACRPTTLPTKTHAGLSPSGIIAFVIYLYDHFLFELHGSPLDTPAAHRDIASFYSNKWARSPSNSPTQLAGDPTNDLGGGPYLAFGCVKVLLVAKLYIHE